MNSPASKLIPTQRFFFARSRPFLYLTLIALFAFGLGIRLLDLTDAPLDFHPWRQLRAASIARGKFYASLPSADPEIRQEAINLGNQYGVMEPQIFESLVAYTYLIVGGEHLWISRLYAVLFWIVGGVFLYLIARRWTSDDGALVSLAFYLIVPFGVTGSRAFLPEPLMVMWTMISIFSLQKWSPESTWKWALTTGVCSGIAILVKIFAMYPIAAAFIAIVITSRGFKRALTDIQTWVVMGVMSLIPTAFYILGTHSVGSASDYLVSWVFGFSNMLLQPGFYVRWLSVLDYLVHLPILFAGLIGLLLLPKPWRAVAIGLWIGYLFIGLSVPSLILSHTYYNLILIPIVALSLASLGDLFLSALTQNTMAWQVLFIGMAIVIIAYPLILSRNALVAKNYRLEAAGWEELKDELPKDGPMIGLTHDYDTRLNYYAWTAVSHWPYASDLEMLELSGKMYDVNDPDWISFFESKTRGYDYFVVTAMNELEVQPVLKSILYEDYEIYAESTEGERYIIFDLREKKQ